MDIKIIRWENIPCWYDLSWQARKSAILLRVHKDFIASVEPISEDAPIVQSLKQKFEFTSFIGNCDGNFGFDNAFIRAGEKNNFVEFIIKMPLPFSL